MKNAVLDAAWTKLREQILAHLHACHAAGRPIPTVTMDVEQMSYSTGRAVARLSDGVVLSERFSLTDACVEHIEATQPQIELTPSIAESIGELRTSENIENVRVLSADVHHALVVVTPRPEVAAEAGGDWSQPTEPFLLTIPARTGATVQ